MLVFFEFVDDAGSFGIFGALSIICIFSVVCVVGCVSVVVGLVV